MDTQQSIPDRSRTVTGAFVFLALSVVFCLFPFNIAFAVNPYDILDQHIDAIGGLEKLRSVKTRHSTGTILYDDLQGRFQTWQEKPLRYRKEVDFSVIKYVEGDSGEQSWLLDTNGRVLIHRDRQTIKRRQVQKLLEEFEHLNPTSPYFSLQYVKQTSVGQRECYLLTLTNTINSDRLQYYFDTDSFFMVKSAFTTPDLKTVSVYDDFRVVDGIIMPFHTVTTYHPIGKIEETRITHYTINTKSPPEAFSVPASKKDYSFPRGQNSTSVSFVIKGNLIYLPVTIKDDTQKWLVDSGSSMSVIDKAYANDLGLLEKGGIRGHGFGGLFNLGFAAIPEYRLADIRLQHQRVYTLEGLKENSYEPQVFGILGYDFLSRFVVEIDFDDKSMTFHEPKSFTYHGTGHIVDAPLKYRTFTLPVKLDKISTGPWSVDLGAHQSSLHYPFAKDNELLRRDGVKTVSKGAAGHSF
ncbi:MAG: aspartyl protease family protein, partial [Desulfopila sp.]